MARAAVARDVSAPSSRADVSRPRLILAQPCAAPSGILGVSGVAFGPRAQVTLSLDTTPIATLTANNLGNFNTSISIPSTELLGSHTITGRPGSSPLAATTGVTIYDWVQLGSDPAHTRYNPCESALSPTTVSQLKQAWSFNAGTGDFMRSAPAAFDGIVYTSSDTTTLYAFNAATGATVWTFTSSYGGSGSSPAVAGGLVYTTSGNASSATLYALNAQTGAQVWTANLASPTTSPVVSNGLVYVGGAKLYAFNAQTGAQVWSSAASTNGFGLPAVGGGAVYTQGSNSSNWLMYALDAGTGAVLWTQVIGGQVYGGPVYSLGQVYFDQYYPYVVFALNASTGAVVWTNSDLGGNTDVPVAVAYKMLYIATDGELFALDTATGAVAFSISSFSDSQAGAPIVANGVLYTVETDTRVHAYNAYNGAPLWNAALQLEWYSPGAVVDAGTLYVVAGTTLAVFRLPASLQVRLRRSPAQAHPHR